MREVGEMVQITDSQVHIWAADSPSRRWPVGGAARAQRPVPLEAGDLIEEMDAAGVDRAVIVPPSWEGDRNDVALAAAARFPERLAVMGRITLDRPSSDDFSAWRDQPGMLGVRLTFLLGARVADAEWFWPKADAAGLPVMVFGPGQTEEFRAVARRYPELRLIVDHLNVGTGSGIGDLEEAIEPLLSLSSHDNVAVKLSALPCLLKADDSFATLVPHVRRVVDAFGANRCMWGSDLSRLPRPYSDWVEAGRSGLGCLSKEETEQVMGEALASWLDWP
jgi:predicted TIM-barrel fold metal-dependent hydrolase